MSDQVGDQVGTLLRTLRGLEQRHSTVRKKLQLTDQNILQSKKGLHQEIVGLSRELVEMRHSMEKLKYSFTLVEKQLQQTASKQDLDVLSKYVELWQPMNFLTKKEAKILLNE
jgi:hypothetical protein